MALAAVPKRHPALVVCDQCPHPRAAHAPINEQPCRIAGCGCLGFASGEPVATDDEPRGVFLVIPEGYVLTVTLTPVGDDV